MGKILENTRGQLSLNRVALASPLSLGPPSKCLFLQPQHTPRCVLCASPGPFAGHVPPSAPEPGPGAAFRDQQRSPRIPPRPCAAGKLQTWPQEEAAVPAREQPEGRRSPVPGRRQAPSSYLRAGKEGAPAAQPATRARRPNNLNSRSRLPRPVPGAASLPPPGRRAANRPQHPLLSKARRGAPLRPQPAQTAARSARESPAPRRLPPEPPARRRCSLTGEEPAAGDGEPRAGGAPGGHGRSGRGSQGGSRREREREPRALGHSAAALRGASRLGRCLCRRPGRPGAAEGSPVSPTEASKSAPRVSHPRRGATPPAPSRARPAEGLAAAQAPRDVDK